VQSLPRVGANTLMLAQVRFDHTARIVIFMRTV
jgi:hypothetical protein